MRHGARRSAAESEESMGVTEMPRIELAGGRRSALDYPNILRVEPGAVDLTAVLPTTLAMALFLIETIRRFERWLLDNAGLVPGPLHSSIGQEAVAAGMALAMEPVDRLTSTHRAHHDVLARLIVHAAPIGFDPRSAAEPPEAVVSAVRRTLAEILGLAEGLCGGRGGSMHLADAAAGVSTSAIVAGGIPAGAGGALAAKLRANGGAAVAVVGDGGLAIGAFHESAALARAWGLPLILLLQNNRYSVATTLLETAGFEDLAIRAAGYDMPALIVDGMDPIAVLAAMAAAREHAISEGPVLVEALTYRFYHQNGPLPGSAFKYRTRDEEQHWAALDPAVVYPRRLVEGGLLSEAEVENVRDLAANVVDALHRRPHRIDAGRRANPARAIPGPQHDRGRDPRPRPAARGPRADRLRSRLPAPRRSPTPPRSRASSPAGSSATRRPSSSARRSATWAAAWSA